MTQPGVFYLIARLSGNECTSSITLDLKPSQPNILSFSPSLLFSLLAQFDDIDTDCSNRGNLTMKYFPLAGYMSFMGYYENRMLAAQLCSSRADMVVAISIIRWVCHDPLPPGSRVNDDESSASISAVPNYWDSARDKRWREEGCECLRGEKRRRLGPQCFQRPGSMTPSFTCKREMPRRLHHYVFASDESQIPIHRQQIIIGIPLMIHQMPSYPFQQSGLVGWPKFLNKLVPMKRTRSISNSYRLVIVYLNIKRG